MKKKNISCDTKEIKNILSKNGTYSELAKEHIKQIKKEADNLEIEFSNISDKIRLLLWYSWIQTFF